MGLIYMKISPSGGKYIGKTSRTEEIRWKEHIYEALNSNDDNYNSIFNKAIRKYGAENFITEILEENIPDDMLSKKEQYWINYHRTFYLDDNHGYNMTRGGEGTSLYDAQQIKSLWEQGFSVSEMQGIIQCKYSAIHSRLRAQNVSSEEIRKRGAILASTRARITRTQQQLNKHNIIFHLWQKGKSQGEISQELPYCEEFIHKSLLFNGITSEEIAQRGKAIQLKNRQNTLKMLVADRDQKILDLWAQGFSINDIYKITGHARDTIHNILIKHNITEQQIANQSAKVIVRKNSHKILQLDLQGNLIQEWESAAAAAKELGFDSSGIRKCVRGILKTSYGFLWRESIDK